MTTPTPASIDALALDSDAATVADLAVRAAGPHQLEPGLWALVRPDGEVTELDHRDDEAHLPNPRAKRGRYEVDDHADLARYVDAHDTPGTQLWADPDKNQVVAVLDGHTPGADGAPGWSLHRAVWRARRTADWGRWRALDSKLLDQVEFAEHVEDLLHTIAEPPAADLLELAQTFEATTSAEFKSGQRLADGQRQLTYSEDIDAKAGTRGQLTIPAAISVVVEPFEGSAAATVRARFRYRLNAGTLKVGYVLDRPDRVERDAFDGAVEEIALALQRAATTVPIYTGRDAGLA